LKKIAVIGAGNGGQAVAGFLGMKGYKVFLHDIDIDKLKPISDCGGIFLEGKLNGFGKISLVTNDIRTAIEGAEIIFITTTADAHRSVAEQVSQYLCENQIVILHPGRTGGALEFHQTLLKYGCLKRIYLAEAQTLVYACRLITQGKVNIVGIKDRVMLSALPSSNTGYVIEKIRAIFPCFTPADNVLVTGLENIGAIFHPCVVLFNAAAIERGNQFYFYRDMTPHIAQFINQFDKERLAIGNAFGIKLISAEEWVSYAYSNIEGNTLCEKMRNNPAYYNILAPTYIHSRQLTEDIPTGILPMAELGRIAGVKVDLMRSVLTIASSLLNINFIKTGRTLDRLGLEGCSINDILKIVQ
jgi:opine dehydrogenase